MGLYKYIREAWKKPKTNDMWKQRLIQWRKEPVSQRIDKPTRLDRARSLGYRAKPGIIIIRQRISRSKRQRPKFHGGRSPRKMRRKLVLDMNYQHVAERRAVQKYKNNCEVLNSYWVAEDGKSKWYEVILVDTSHPVIKNDPTLKWICTPANTGRVFRGLTSAGKKSRGLRSKGIGAEKIRPSRAAVYRKKHK
jgi:large subunit ribosomal protein L15e